MIVLRVDDFPTTRVEESPSRNAETYREFHDVVMSSWGREYMLAVIPLRTSDVELEHLGGICGDDVEPAIHGMRHVDDGYEFPPWASGQEVAAALRPQMARFRDLFGTSAEVYCAPRNDLTPNVACGVRVAKLDAVTSGPGMTEHGLAAARALGLTVIDSRPPHEYGRTDEMLERGAVEALLARPSDEPVCVTLHWTWEMNIGLRTTGRFLCEIAQRATPFTWRLFQR